MNNHCIGVFDSGVGGFSVLREVASNVSADIIYYGDTKNAPYGNKQKEEIVFLIKNIITYLKNQNVTYFISACNSMSVHTTEKLLEEVGIDKENYMDMVTAVEKYFNAPKNSKILIIGTQATISSGIYQEILLKKLFEVDFFVPKNLALAIENDDISIIRKNVKDILDHAFKIKATHILYACTHYPLMHDEFESYKNISRWVGDFIDPAVYVASAVKGWDINGKKNISFQSSKMTPVFERYMMLFTR